MISTPSGKQRGFGDFIALVFLLATGWVAVFVLFCLIAPRYSIDPTEAAPAALNFLHKTAIGNIALYSIPILSSVLLLYLFLLPRQLRFRRLANNPRRWFILLIFLLMPAVPLTLPYGHNILYAIKVIEPSSLAFSEKLLQYARVLLVLSAGWLPFLTASYICVQLGKSLTFEVYKAYETAIVRNDQYRSQYIASNYPAILSREAATMVQCDRDTRPARISFLTDGWRGKERLDEDVLLQYYREPLLLLKLAKVHYGATAAFGGYPLMTDSQHSGPPSIPDTFDIVRIEQDLLRYRFDQPLISVYFVDLFTRFRAKSYRKKLRELMEIHDFAIQFQGNIYKFRKEEGRARSIADLENTLEAEELTTKIYKERKKREEFQSPIESSPDEARLQDLTETEKQLRHEYRIKDIEDRIKGDYDKGKRRRFSKELDEMIASHTQQKLDIENNPHLTPDLKQESLRLLERDFIKQLDEFEQTM